ncbi:carbamoyltransferase HypF [Alteromonas lipolytica]|uniref:Carbamoyltransferase HypF n=1 Tax=Alteromonas lipolytica TaxID=1856405 RepID=A0A1E8FEE1_9ALTE|nr:carbamoyltransferase HypF [Alteromonas lipolytica]OFI34126.1 carbamoyltransferase HypF [Alteromonas lipolytica]GGF65185.1 carbamoyltransferase HypF [Alteromonas lipolytica]
MGHPQNGVRLSVSGIVQGVGFRPFIWRIATESGLNGQVFNDAAGVKIDLLCSEETARQFARQISESLPALARIDEITLEKVAVSKVNGFHIVTSRSGNVTTGCAPDAATCAECLAELLDPQGRRYQYPFINCTNCGPRLSIIRQIPYDRASTTMADFALCAACQAEYTNPADRRFHAQPNACAECGPHCWLELPGREKVASDSPFAELARVVKSGGIIAVKGIGGVHLACDATNEQAVTQLRERKQRPDKALALMAKDMSMIARYASVSPQDEALLTSPAAPVVLLYPHQTAKSVIASGIAPDTALLGFMLPYSPVHYLLMDHLDVPLVMTSGNRSGMPQAITNDDAREQLADIADLMLLHDRPIHNRLDDSVVMSGPDSPQVLRRARGYAPTSLPLPPGFTDSEPLIALGGQLKSTLCLINNNRAIVTQHLGDLHDASTFEQYLHTLSLYQQLYAITPTRYSCDTHPEYIATKHAVSLEEQGHKVVRVQHHHAHIAACLGDNRYPLDGPAVLGICLDGTGYGEDETLWGGEFLIGGYAGMQRVASLMPVALIGGAQAIRSPWRSLYAQLRRVVSAAEMASLADICPQLASPMCKSFEKMLSMQLNSPLSSSAGRLFDAVAAALGCAPEHISYEGQAAIKLETLAAECHSEVTPYRFTLTQNHIEPASFWPQIIADLRRGRSRAEMALAFHLGFAAALVEMTHRLAERYAFATVVLSGGVMQNQLLNAQLTQALNGAGFKVLTHQQLPANDGGISYGQALVTLARTIGTPCS